MPLKKITSLIFSCSLLCGCQVGYLAENAYYQADLLLSRTPLEEALKDENLSKEQKRKLKLAKEAKDFAETELFLKPSQNYTSFSQLDGNYVVHSLTVAPKDKLEPYTWSFPFFGSFPYLGFFNKRSARMSQKRYQDANYDTYLRGVSAFSTLGWFSDPILSSMLRYSDYDLVNTIIHETVHATIYIKNAVDFNERLATYIGNIGTEKFYIQKEGSDSPTLKKTRLSNADDRIFSSFITKELNDLEKWYEDQKQPPTEETRQKRFAQMRQNFKDKALPLMQTKYYSWFSQAELNNARLLNYRTYYKDLKDFEKLYQLLGKDFKKLIEFCISLEKSSDPEKALKEKVRTN